MKILRSFQKNEITEYYVYKLLAKITRGSNRKILQEIAGDELKHYSILKNYSNKDVKPKYLKIIWHLILFFIFGITFSLNAMEKGEEKAQEKYKVLKDEITEIEKIILDENIHEKKLLSLIDEEKVKYISSMVLGLNDALVELTGTLAGLTFAFQNSKLVALSGLITGIAASFSMSASEYLSQRADENAQNPIKSAVYTGIAYIFTVFLLVLPYLVLSNPFFALIFLLFIALIIIVFFSYFVSVVQDKSFKMYFLEMFLISFGVMGVSFVIGIIAKKLFNIEIL
ncbi:membrane protein [Thermosipho melanesiensis]|uniref:Membrane protein n=1 Tax=Thermosipho melanesiensis TaxID=46541 RepID=A0ABN4UWZ7_9BACT|nr:membrane protein [Thermosipho melanesiensis]OOC35252.1 membrane protein [Thermosipho melanesiensis]OOC35462.1 membrane protein [Thermosipho melanesiensis]OOC36820.1 membrane protein [Thermosipho melanesiensis]OOC40034.1 membrane protein [Thermosipho melanesiensis]